MKFCGPGLGRAITRGVALIPLFLMGPWTGLVSASPFAYITSFYPNNVSVIDTATNTVVATVPVGAHPTGVAVTPAGTRVYVASQFSHTVSVIDTATNTVVATVPVGSSPHGVAVTPSGTRVYVANQGTPHTVSVIDTATNTVVTTVPVGSIPHGVAVTPAGTRVYVTNHSSNTVSVIDTATNTVVATVPVGAHPYGVAVTPAGTRVYVTHPTNANVSVIDTATNTVVATVPVGAQPHGVAVTLAGTRVYVANQDTHTVSVIDTATNTVVATVPVGSGPVAFGIFIQQAPPPCIQPPSGMVAWYPLDELTGDTVVKNIVNSGYNGTPVPSPIGPPNFPRPTTSTITPPAVVGGALYFYEHGPQPGFVQVPNATPLNIGTGDFTIDAWVFPVNVGAEFIQPIVDKLDLGATSGYALYIKSPGISNNARLEFVWGNGTLTTTVQSISPITYNTWHHIAVTFKRLQAINPGDPTFELKMYVDGASAGAQSGAPPGGVGTIANTLDLFIGGTRANTPTDGGRSRLTNWKSSTAPSPRAKFKPSTTPVAPASVSHSWMWPSRLRTPLPTR